MIELLALVAVNTGAWMFASRALYRRSRLAAKTAVEYRSTSIRRAPGQPDALLAALSMVMGVLWPLVLVSFFVTARPPLTSKEKDELLAERDAELVRQRVHVDRLEKELGIARGAGR